MSVDKKMVTAFLLATVIVTGTALASLRTTVTTESVSIGTNPTIAASTVTTTTTATTHEVSHVDTTMSMTSQDAALANLIFRILGIPVSVHEITTYQTRYHLGNGEITLAYNLAAASGKSVDEILMMRFERKMGWGKIAKVLGVKLHGAVDNSVVILQQASLHKDVDDLRFSVRIDLEDNDTKDKVKNSDQDRDDDNKKDHGKNHGKNK